MVAVAQSVVHRYPVFHMGTDVRRRRAHCHCDNQGCATQMTYRLIRRRSTVELDCASDLIARQYAMADRTVERVETDTGRVVYRRATDQLPDIDMEECFKGAKK